MTENVDNVLRKDGFVNLDLNKARSNIQKLDRTLVGSLLGRRLPFWVVQNELNRKWGHMGLTQITPMGADCFLCWFVNMEARNSVLIGGPWLPNLPLEYWDESNLARLAMGIGEPLFMDEKTKLWNRCAFARICIRLDLSKRLPKGIWANGLEGAFFQPIEYEGIPLICLNCGKVGHKADLCKEVQARPKQQELKTGEVKDQFCSIADGLGVAANSSDVGLSCSLGLEGAVSRLNFGKIYEVVGSTYADIDHGEWTIVTRRKRPNIKAGAKTIMRDSKPAVLAPKTVWREVSKTQKEVDVLHEKENAKSVAKDSSTSENQLMDVTPSGNKLPCDMLVDSKLNPGGLK
ncbi:uncharacterized protein LOC110100191 [Dendrobium catenatum]|uniref:uncharacterized protein LOC110100191 n=1 Tax=Dendrobium catenatum TaxID=906689 RepID=UPI00109EF945|nr:uncharacterized protein LOC110100191 [Dendrobium catenatum]